MKSEKGFSLVEVVAAIALLGVIAVAFLSALATASTAIFITDERATAESLARTQMEYVKICGYDYYKPGDPPSYEQVDVESSAHPGYFISVEAIPIDPATGDALSNPEDDIGMQKIIVTVKLPDYTSEDPKEIALVGYKRGR